MQSHIKDTTIYATTEVFSLPFAAPCLGASTLHLHVMWYFWERKWFHLQL